MPKWVVYAAAWVAAATAAVVVAFWGIGIVGDQVTGERPAPLSAEEVALRATSTTTTAPPGTGPTTTATVAPATTPTTAPSGVPASAPTTTTTAAPPPPQPEGETRTYNLVGGSTALRFSPSGVTVVWANPNPGFDVESEPEDGNGVKVEFRSEEHRSRIDAWWDGGPQHEIREEEDGGGGSGPG